MKSFVWKTILLMALPVLTGCASFRAIHDEVKTHNSIWIAYRSEACPAKCGSFSGDFECGWKQAYYNIAHGADPCPPSMPPQKYWKAEPGRVSSWLSGYRHGVRVALSNGVHVQARVPVISMCVRESEIECCPEGYGFASQRYEAEELPIPAPIGHED